MNLLKKLFKKVKPVSEEPVSEERSLWDEMIDGCPECGCSPIRLMEGPSGGACTNVFCADCGQGYNIAPSIQWAEKIHKDLRYIEIPSSRTK